jgi:glycosyltransferase involved in cell wall biosynthesis
MHWIGLVDSPGHVCGRYRLAAFRPWWERAGHTLELRSLPRGWWGRLRLFRELAGANVIMLRRLLPSWLLARLRHAAARLVYDFDDALFLRDSYSSKAPHDPRRLRRFAATLRACDAVVAGNAFLQKQALRWAAGPVHLIPTCVDVGRYPVATQTRAAGWAQMVWVGSASTLQGLEQARPILEELGRRLSGVHLNLLCDRFLVCRHLSVTPCLWREENEAAEIAAADIGISWVPDDLWSRGKCGLKVLQYMAAGLPVVCNPVGVHAEIVCHGETGFLAETAEQWVEGIGRLAHDPGLRRRMGEAGRRVVEAGYSTPGGARRWLVLFDRLRQGTAIAG